MTEQEKQNKIYELGISEGGKLLIETLKESVELAKNKIIRNKQLGIEEIRQLIEQARALESVIFILTKKPENIGGEQK